MLPVAFDVMVTASGLSDSAIIADKRHSLLGPATSDVTLPLPKLTLDAASFRKLIDLS